MTTVVNFAGAAPSRSICLKPMPAGPATGFLCVKRTCQFEQNRTDHTQQQIFYVKRKEENKMFNDHRPFHVMVTRGYSDDFPGPPSPSDTIKQFYKCINEKNLKQLGDYVSQDCYIEECSFNNPLQGKKEVMKFYEQLTTGMGQNVKFIIRHVCEGDELTAAANWHMEWKDKQIPFTRGCTFFEFSKGGDKLILKKAQIVIESPIKPGTLVLTLLKTVTSLFDEFPKTTEWFLKSPHIILQWIWKIYTILLAPLVESYLKLWSLAARLLGYAYYILLNIAKLFFK